MPEAKCLNPEARLRAEVEHAVAPYVGVASPVVLAKLREIAERYYREHPQAAGALRLLDRGQRTRSGPESVAPRDVEPATARAGRR